jgi:hypothetical protein
VRGAFGGQSGSRVFRERPNHVRRRNVYRHPSPPSLFSPKESSAADPVESAASAEVGHLASPASAAWNISAAALVRVGIISMRDHTRT